MNIVADFWEDHCVECGEPECFKSCPRFLRGGHGRCERVEFLGCGHVKIREWGKIELLWHGRVVDPETAEMLNAWNSRWEPLAKALQKALAWLPLPYGRGPYGVFRSLRWRKARRCGVDGRPVKWIFAASSRVPVSLSLEVRSPSGDVAASWIFKTSHQRLRVEFDLPPVVEGSLFSIFPTDSAFPAEIDIAENLLATADTSFVKCVAWDLDGVVWRGTLSEGDDVKVDESVMNAVRMLDARGIVSSICSKNDGPEALAKLAELGIEKWFVFPQINWGPKSESLKRLAAEMNIGLDSVAFVDDRGENRAEVRASLPQVRVYSEADVATFASCPEFSAVASDEGKGCLGSTRRRMYREDMMRRKARSCFPGDSAEFSAASGLEFSLLPVEGSVRNRCLELVKRTNQLNLTGRRYSSAGFDALLSSAESRAVRVLDRYGDYGVVGFVAWKETRLVECCFSCRVAKRGIERRVLDEISHGRKFTAEVVVTDRNGPIREIVDEWLHR